MQTWICAGCGKKFLIEKGDEDGLKKVTKHVFAHSKKGKKPSWFKRILNLKLLRSL